MKTTAKIIGICFLLLVFSCKSADVPKQSKEEAIAALQVKIDSRDYKIEIDRVYPMGGRSISPSSPYSLTIKGDSVYSYLPYFGRGYSLPYGGGEGLNFDSTIKDYSLEYTTKGVARISFSTQSREDSFSFSIEVFPGGSSSIHVAPTKRQMISYSGDLLEIEASEDEAAQ